MGIIENLGWDEINYVKPQCVVIYPVWLRQVGKKIERAKNNEYVRSNFRYVD